MMVSAVTAPEFPDDGILWRGFNDDTLRLIAERDKPALLFVANPDPMVWPFLRETFKAMPKNEKLRQLLHDDGCPALFLKADEIPEDLKAFGAGSRYNIAVLSPSGLTPMVTIDPIAGNPAAVVDHIVAVLERILAAWL
jgi:hypothetical protein